MKRFQTVFVGFLLLLTTYCGSYIVLRLAGMRFGAHRSDVNGVSRIITHVYFGNGDNKMTRMARVVYFPMHKAEHLWQCRTRTVFVYN
jgi:hypothetical protein